MSWLAVSLALAREPSRVDGLPWYTGRLVTTDRVHLGARLHAFVDNENSGALEYGFAVTVRVTTLAL